MVSLRPMGNSRVMPRRRQPTAGNRSNQVMGSLNHLIPVNPNSRDTASHPHTASPLLMDSPLTVSSPVIRRHTMPHMPDK